MLKTRKYNYSEIADIVGCSVQTVGRDAKKFDLQVGQGVIHYWEFSKPDSYLAYLVGIIITDGTIAKAYKTGVPKSVKVMSITREIIKHSQECLENIGLDKAIKLAKRKYKANNKNVQDIFWLSCYSTMFAKWVNKATNNRDIFPDFVFDMNNECKMSLLAGIIDGDGSVDKDGSIAIRATNKWMKDLPEILSSLNIRTGGYHVERVLESGKDYGRVSIRRSDYRSLGGTCYHPIKKERILHAKDTREHEYKPKWYKCPECGRKTKSKNADMCKECYLKSEKHLNHCREIASKGSRAGNIARWGTGWLEKNEHQNS